jgi:hypothetical protein
MKLAVVLLMLAAQDAARSGSASALTAAGGPDRGASMRSASMPQPRNRWRYSAT